MTTPWHAHREDVFAVMRQIDDVVQYAWRRARELGPRNGCISVGSADYDYTLQATIGEQFLRSLRTGSAPSSAYTASVEAGNDSIKKWNTTGCLSRMAASGRFEFHRNECSAESIALGFLTRFPRTETTPPECSLTANVRLQPAIIDGSRYCGPVCLSALTGLGTRQIARVLRDQFAIGAVRGLNIDQMRWFLELVGYQLREPDTRQATIVDLGRSGESTHLVHVLDHWMLVAGKRIVCTQFVTIGDTADSMYRNEKIVAAYEITGKLNESVIRSLQQARRSRSPATGQLALF